MKYAPIFLAALLLSVPVLADTPSVLSTAQPEAADQDSLHASAILCFEALKAGDLSRLEAVGSMLRDPRLCTAARTTLENLPNRAGLETLRGGLGAADDRCVAEAAASLGAMRDVESVGKLIDLASCDCHAELIREVALRSLGKLATDEAIAALRAGVLDAHLNVQKAAADGLFIAAQNHPEKAPEYFRLVRDAKIDGPLTRIAAQNEILLSGETALFLTLLKSSDPADFRSAQIVLAQAASKPETAKTFEALSRAAISALSEISTKNQSALLATLGVSGSQTLTEPLLALLAGTENAQASEKSLSRTAILEAVGNLKDARALPTFERLLASEDEAEREAAEKAICQLKPEEVRETVKVLISHVWAADAEVRETRLTLAGIEIAGTLKMTCLLPELKERMLNAPSPEIASAAMRVYSQILVPTPGDVAEFATVFAGKTLASEEVFETAMANLCKKTTAKAETIDFLQKTYAAQPVRLVRYVGMVGGKAAAECLGEIASRSAAEESAENLAVIDEATKALGKWATADAAPVLARLAVTLPNEKFRTRTLRGYLRILRQMGMTPLEKRQMLNTALALTDGKPAERERFEFLVSRFNQEFPEKQLFNGKDFTGWEMVADVFKIEDGAIVGGNFETGVDRNQFLTTKERFGDFYLRMECRILDGPANEKKDGNAGVQIRSERIPNNHEMIGYQADMTSNGAYWGHLYDESRRRKMLQTPSAELIRSVWKPNEWNRYEILCQGRNIRIFLNGVETVNYTESDEAIPQEGLIGLQIHAGGPARSYYRNVFISTSATSDSRW